MMIACCNDGTRPVIFKIERIVIPETAEEECRHSDIDHIGDRGNYLFGINGQGLTSFIACTFDLFINDRHYLVKPTFSDTFYLAQITDSDKAEGKYYFETTRDGLEIQCYIYNGVLKSFTIHYK